MTLRELAEAAYRDYGLAEIAVGGGERATISVPAFIQAASPAAILELLDERDRLARQLTNVLDEVEQWRDAPDVLASIVTVNRQPLSQPRREPCPEEKG